MITKDHLRALQWAAARSRRLAKRVNTPGIHLHRAEQLEDLARIVDGALYGHTRKPKKRTMNIETSTPVALD